MDHEIGMIPIINFRNVEKYLVRMYVVIHIYMYIWGMNISGAPIHTHRISTQSPLEKYTVLFCRGMVRSESFWVVGMVNDLPYGRQGAYSGKGLALYSISSCCTCTHKVPTFHRVRGLTKCRRRNTAYYFFHTISLFFSVIPKSRFLSKKMEKKGSKKCKIRETSDKNGITTTLP